jgi:hypothetical protein
MVLPPNRVEGKDMRILRIFGYDKTFTQPIVWVTTLVMVAFHIGRPHSERGMQRASSQHHRSLDDRAYRH